jgi:hypothetical protein
MEGQDAMEQQYAPMAQAFGYSTVQGFLASPNGMMWAGTMEADKQALREQYPQGWELTTQFENQDSIDAAALQDLAKKSDKTEGEEAFLELLDRQQSLQTMGQYFPETLSSTMESSGIRNFALRWVHDQRFAELYDRFMTRTYGPIRRVS